MADNGQTIIDLDKKRMQAMAEKDFATLNAVLAERVKLAPLREDIAGATTAGSLARTLGASARPIALGPETLGAAADPVKRVAFLRQWQQAFSGGAR